MKDVLISRNALIHAINSMVIPYEDRLNVIKTIDSMPGTTKLEAKWDIEPETEIICGLVFPRPFRRRFCSFCKNEALEDECHGYFLTNYCPNCGAEMKKEGEP